MLNKKFVRDRTLKRMLQAGPPEKGLYFPYSGQFSSSSPWLRPGFVFASNTVDRQLKAIDWLPGFLEECLQEFKGKRWGDVDKETAARNTEAVRRSNYEASVPIFAYYKLPKPVKYFNREGQATTKAICIRATSYDYAIIFFQGEE